MRVLVLDEEFLIVEVYQNGKLFYWHECKTNYELAAMKRMWLELI